MSGAGKEQRENLIVSTSDLAFLLYHMSATADKAVVKRIRKKYMNHLPVHWQDKINKAYEPS